MTETGGGFRAGAGMRCGGRPVTCVGDNCGMRVPYTPSTAPDRTFEIESDRHGSYTVMLDGKVVKRVTALANYLGRPRWGSKRLEVDAIKDGKQAVDLILADRAR